MKTLTILSGGAAAGVVQGIQADFESVHACDVNGTFNAVGAMRDQLIAGAACDVIILTKSLIEGLIASGHVMPGTDRSLGIVKTGVAVKAGSPHPAISSPEELKEAFLNANGIYFPDPIKATAGIHVMKVLTALGLDQTLSHKFRPYPNGNLAMAAMAACPEGQLIGSTQVTEINITAGVELIGNLPKEFELATDYTLGICSNAKELELAQMMTDILVGEGSEIIRRKIGYEF